MESQDAISLILPNFPMLHFKHHAHKNIVSFSVTRSSDQPAGAKKRRSEIAIGIITQHVKKNVNWHQHSPINWVTSGTENNNIRNRYKVPSYNSQKALQKCNFSITYTMHTVSINQCMWNKNQTLKSQISSVSTRHFSPWLQRQHRFFHTFVVKKWPLWRFWGEKCTAFFCFIFSYLFSFLWMNGDRDNEPKNCTRSDKPKTKWEHRVVTPLYLSSDKNDILRRPAAPPSPLQSNLATQFNSTLRT